MHRQILRIWSGLFEDIGSALENRVVARFTAAESGYTEVTFGAIYGDDFVATASQS